MNIDSTKQTLGPAGPAPATRADQTPTQKQIEALASANDDQLIEKAVQALHALNHRATKIRNHKSEFGKASYATALARETEFIHNLGATFLDALALASRANVYTLEVDRSEDDEPCERKCLLCDRVWVGGRRCRCGTNITMAMPETLYVFDCGNGFRFHLAEDAVSDEVLDLASNIEPHDPSQSQRETPRVGLTVEAQKACVRLAIDRLGRAGTDGPNDQPDRERINEEPFEIMDAPAGLDLQVLEHLPVATTAQARSAIGLARKSSVALDVLLDHCRASPYLVVHVEEAESGAPRYLIAASDLGAEWVCGLTQEPVM
jgi:hypothetical protein